MVLKILVLWVVFNITVDLNTYPTMEDSAKAIEGCIYTLGVLQWSVCSMIWSADRMVCSSQGSIANASQASGVWWVVCVF